LGYKKVGLWQPESGISYDARDFQTPFLALFPFFINTTEINLKRASSDVTKKQKTLQKEHQHTHRKIERQTNRQTDFSKAYFLLYLKIISLFSFHSAFFRSVASSDGAYWAWVVPSNFNSFSTSIDSLGKLQWGGPPVSPL
jgi:hypothetical protein